MATPKETAQRADLAPRLVESLEPANIDRDVADAWAREVAARLRERDYISKDPTVLLFTFDELVSIKNHVYTPALSRVTEHEI